MKAMVLAAGQGTRLRPLTEKTPKPMVPIGNIPLLERTVRWLAREGVKDVIINLHHMPDVIVDYIGNGGLFGVNVTYSHEPTLLGTAGAIKRCESQLGSEPFAVIYGDNLVDVSLQPLVERQELDDADAVIGLFEAADPTACGLVLTDPSGRITRFEEKPPRELVFTNQANAGVYILSPRVLEFIPPDTPYDFGKDVFPKMLSAGCNLVGVVLSGYLQDTGTPDSYRQANIDVLSGKQIGLRGKFVGSGPNFTLVGDQARIGPNVSFQGYNIIGARTHVGAGSVLTNTIIWEDVTIPDDLHLTGAVIGSGVKLEPLVLVDNDSLIA